ncbi:hypothetical protein [Vibrio gangliei]|uniref:hypothetical protein n=1 Tax=Vibrio gangliei TaxID=2077090 RepID=UPI0013003A14|nr:hypothetical protein [Vibrio gangliei]
MSQLPLTPSLLLIILSLFALHSLYRRSLSQNNQDRFSLIQRLDRQWCEFGIQIVLHNGGLIRIFRHQMLEQDYKRLNALLDEGEGHISCLVQLKEMESKHQTEKSVRGK